MVPEITEARVKVQKYTSIFIWLHTLLISLTLFFLIDAYSILEANTLSLHQTNKAIAATSFVLIGVSFALSGLSFFFGVKNILYRKFLGLSGFTFALAHAALSLLLFEFPRFFLNNHAGLPFFFSLLALLIFTGMAAISNACAMKKLGGKDWRYLLRFGYLGYFLTMCHFLYSGMPKIIIWMGNFMSILPPISFLLIVFGTFVLLLRLSLQIALIVQAKK